MIRYVLGPQEENGFYGILALSEDGKIADAVENLSDRKEELENAVMIFNNNKLPLVNFRKAVELLLGVLI